VDSVSVSIWAFSPKPFTRFGSKAIGVNEDEPKKSRSPIIGWPLDLLPVRHGVAELEYFDEYRHVGR
jgi:hypothetical protein